MSKQKDETKTQETAAVEVSRFAVATFEENGFEKLTLPPFVTPDSIPIGGAVIGKIIKVIGDFTGKEGMEDTKNIWMQNAGGEFLLPMTGVIGNALLKVNGGEGSIIGKTLAVKRLPDEKDKKFHNRMFMFEVFIK